ncbi:MAG TPA: RNA polymerase sigma factor [Candidatus Omnitrophota bacterium]|nr:RNA polymerase sigma factor [Candidatus Omnitrophota bacterium]
MESRDEDLILAYQDGDKEALEVIFHRYKKPIFNYALRILSDRAEAEDIVSDIFITLFVKKDSYKPQAKFSTWLYTVARHMCFTRLRQKRRFFAFWVKDKKEDEYHQMDIPDISLNPEKVTAEEELSSAVQKALNKLPALQKEVIVLREYQNLSYQEISLVLDCSLEKVKILIFRARENLKKHLAFLITEERYEAS